MTIKDLFSEQAETYALFRPSYPEELFDFIAGKVKNRNLAWDCATGSGQAAHSLSSRFKRVIGTDVSKRQLANAMPAGNIEYMICRAECTPFKDDFFDLITVAQAIHWFDLEEFFNEAIRVSKNGGIIAFWGYGLFSCKGIAQTIISDFYDKTLNNCWEPERKLIDGEYKEIEMPLAELETPGFNIRVLWNLKHLKGYLESWSAVQKFRKTFNSDPVGPFIDELAKSWQEGEEREISFPVFLRMGIVRK